MEKVNKKQRLRDFIDSRPRGVITRLAEYVDVSTVSVHGWLDDQKGWMTRNNAKKVEEFIRQEQEAVQLESEERKEGLSNVATEQQMAIAKQIVMLEQGLRELAEMLATVGIPTTGETVRERRRIG